MDFSVFFIDLFTFEKSHASALWRINFAIYLTLSDHSLIAYFIFASSMPYRHNAKRFARQWTYFYLRVLKYKCPQSPFWEEVRPKSTCLNFYFFYNNFGKHGPIFIFFFTVKFKKDLQRKMELKLPPLLISVATQNIEETRHWKNINVPTLPIN